MKTLLLVCMMAFCGTACAQTSTDSTANIPDQLRKGSSIIGLNGSYSNSAQDYLQNNGSQRYENTAYRIGLKYGVMLSDRSEIGVNLGYTRTNQKNVNTGFPNESHTNSYLGGLYGRQYFPFLKRFAGYGQIAAGYSYGKSKDGDQSSPAVITVYDDYSAGIALGIAYFTRNHFSFDLGFNLAAFQYSQYKRNDLQNGSFVETQKYHTTNFTLGPNGATLVGAGISYYFGGKN